MGEEIKKIHITFSHDSIKIAKSTVFHKLGQILNTAIEIKTAKVFHKVLNRGRILNIFEKADYEVLGSVLFKIFAGDEVIKTYLNNILKDIIRDTVRCRIYLEFENDILDMSALPWEYLMLEECEEYDAFFIAADHNKQFDFIRLYSNIESRHLNFNADERSQLNVVLVVINNNDTEDPKLIIGDSWKKSFKKLTNNNKSIDDQNVSRFKLFVLENVIFETLAEDLKGLVDNITGPYILHFLGHASMEKEKATIGFTAKNGATEWIDAEILADVFDESLGIRLPSVVMLQACESGQLNSKGFGLGAALLATGIPAVVAMQNEVTVDISLALMEKIYTSLLNGDDIGKAVTQGRYYLGCEYKKNKDKPSEYYDTNAFGTPVLYINTEEPIRVMPKDTFKTETIRIVKRCARGHTYVNYKPDICPEMDCRLPLEVISGPASAINIATAANASSAAPGTNSSGAAVAASAVNSTPSMDKNTLSATTTLSDQSTSSHAR